MPEFYTHHRTLLPNDFYALDYAIREDADYPGNESIIRIFNKEHKLVNEFKTLGEVKEMCCIKKTGRLAIVMEGGRQVSFYDPHANTPDKIDQIQYDTRIQALLATEEHLLVSENGILRILNNSTFKELRTIKLGNFILGMSLLNNYVFCDVRKNGRRVSQVDMYDYHEGTLVRNIGPQRDVLHDFTGVLKNGNVFIAVLRESAIYLYCSKTGEQLNSIKIKIKASERLFVCSLPLGGLAVYHGEEANKKIKIYHPGAKEPTNTYENIPDDLLSQEDMNWYISNRERSSSLILLKNTVQTLGEIGLFKAPIDCLIADYSVSRNALEQDEVDKALKTLVLK